jgi:hypothetical protein
LIFRTSIQFTQATVVPAPAALHRRLATGNARRPGDVCWLTQYAWALLEAGEDLVVLAAFGSRSSARDGAAAAAAGLSGVELLRELVCSTASSADCKLVMDAPMAAAAGISLEQVSWCQPVNFLPYFNLCILCDYECVVPTVPA